MPPQRRSMFNQGGNDETPNAQPLTGAPQRLLQRPPMTGAPTGQAGAAAVPGGQPGGGMGMPGMPGGPGGRPPLPPLAPNSGGAMSPMNAGRMTQPAMGTARNGPGDAGPSGARAAQPQPPLQQSQPPMTLPPWGQQGTRPGSMGMDVGGGPGGGPGGAGGANGAMGYGMPQQPQGMGAMGGSRGAGGPMGAGDGGVPSLMTKLKLMKALGRI